MKEHNFFATVDNIKFLMLNKCFADARNHILHVDTFELSDYTTKYIGNLEKKS